MRWRAKPTKVEGDRPPTRKGPKSGDAQVRDLEKRLAEALKRESEAAEQQSATSEILRVISRSPTDLQPVLDTVVASAARYCGAYDATMLRLDEGSLRLAAHHGPIPIPVGRPIPVVRGTTSGRAVLERRAVHVADIQVEAGEFPESGAFAKELGYRTQLSVPLLREGAAIGTIVLRRIEMNPFTDTQIALLETFADQAVIAIENVRLFNETKEALEQQTATSEILRVISSSPTDVQPVLDAVTRSASRLCEAKDAGVWLRDDETLVIRAHNGPIPMPPQRLPISRDWVTGRAVLDGRPIHVDNLATAGEEFPEGQAMALRDGHRTTLAIPLVREGKAIGAILIRRTEVRPFSDKHIALLKTFADQAVIAMENVRLFNETKEALEQQTATSEILRVISSSPTDVQPVFETIAANALRLCAAKLCTVFRFDGTLIHLVALDQVSTEGAAAYRDAYPAPPGRGGGTHRAILTRSIVHIPDIREDPEYELQALARANDFGCVLSVPMLRDGQPVGAITVGREAGRAFPDEQIELLKTFADQALIAIENVRLFNETKEALEQQTATSEVLKVISRSAFDLESVLETLIENAVRLCGASRGSVYRVDGNLLRHAISYNVSRDTADFFDRNPLAPGRYSIAARVALERRTQHIPDILVDSEYTFGVHQVEPIRTALGVPMMKGDRLIGAFTIWKLEVQPFTDRQIELVTTFADQAVIAIENVRLFTELQARTAELTRSVGELTALGEVSQALSSTLDLEAVLNTIVSRASQLAGAAGCSIYEYDEAAERFELRATHNPDSKFVEALRAAPLRKGEGVMGRATEMREPIQISDIAQPGAYQSSVRDILLRFGYRALLSVPLLREDQIIGSLSFNRKAPGEFPPEVVDVLKTFATQSALAIQNARLFHEIADKSRQLEVASQHKSEFLANMSHELRTPLNAILGFSEVLAQGMFGPVNEKQTEYLNDILESGRHLLSLINDILDLSKIEAGRMELELSEFDLPQAIQNALTLVRERALRRGIALHHAIDDRLAAIRADERKVKQVLLNLLSNAVKFTPEGGRIEVRAAPADGKVEVSVTDTGIGIASEDLETVFEEFRQVGTADKKAEGTGLGLALARKFIELHGGRIWVKSEPGRGSTFTFTLPVTRD